MDSAAVRVAFWSAAIAPGSHPNQELINEQASVVSPEAMHKDGRVVCGGEGVEGESADAEERP